MSMGTIPYCGVFSLGAAAAVNCAVQAVRHGMPHLRLVTLRVLEEMMGVFQGSLTGSVGHLGKNLVRDVSIVQNLLNLYHIKINAPLITFDGKNGNETIGAIRNFQLKMFGAADGRVDVNGRSFKKLLQIANETPLRNPKTYAMSVKPFHKVTIGEDGRIFVQVNDWLTKYSAAMYGNYISIYEYFRLQDGKFVVIRNKNELRAGETIYHHPTYAKFMGAKNKIPKEVPPPIPKHEQKRITEEAMKADFDPQGKHGTGVISKLLEYVGYGSNVVEIIALVFAAVEAFSTVLSIVLIPVSYVQSFQTFFSNSNNDIQMYSIRAFAYATTAWAYEQPVPSRSSVRDRMVKQDASVGPRLDNAWANTIKLVPDAQAARAFEYFERQRCSTEVKKEAWKAILREIGKNRPQATAEAIMKNMAEKHLDGRTVKESFMRSMDIQYPS